MITLCSNLKARCATTQFDNFNFDSAVRFGDTILLAGESGLLKYAGDDDNGQGIAAYFEPVTIDLGISNDKRIRFVYLDVIASGNLTMVVSTDRGLSETITVPISGSGNHSVRVPVSRAVYGRYFTFNIGNGDTGLDFSVNRIEVLPIVRGRGQNGN